MRQSWTEPFGYELVTTELDENERARAAAFCLPWDRLLYLSAHIGLRRLLAAYLGAAPGELRFAQEPCPGCGEAHGRPAVAYPPTALHFSLSHSNGLALFGVATAPVGVDVERLPGEETVQLCSSALHPAEQAELEAVAPERRRLAFGRLWTRKEAYLKGIGTGLSRSLAADYLGGDGHRDGADGADGGFARPSGWTVANVPCGSPVAPTHAAAAAVRADGGAAAWPQRVRWLPADCLYEGGAAGLITVDRRVHRTGVGPTGQEGQ
nr:4'-phosphopantetheinyl transferase superfamily protein [Streptomyces boncukensis]